MFSSSAVNINILNHCFIFITCVLKGKMTADRWQKDSFHSRSLADGQLEISNLLVFRNFFGLNLHLLVLVCRHFASR